MSNRERERDIVAEVAVYLLNNPVRSAPEADQVTKVKWRWPNEDATKLGEGVLLASRLMLAAAALCQGEASMLDTVASDLTPMIFPR